MPGIFPRGLAGRGWMAAALVLGAAACSDYPTATAPVPATGNPSSGELLTCSVSLKAGSMACSTPSGSTGGGPSKVLYGGQNSLVRLTGTNIQQVGNTVQFDVTVTNLLTDQAIGTRDGVTADGAGVRVFFASPPSVTGGTGSVSVLNATADSTFTSEEQAYFQYSGVLAPGATSAARTWQFNVAPGVQNFSFSMMVATEAQAKLVISELMANPGGALQDSVGEYVEVYNAGRFPVNLRGFVVSDNNGVDTISADVVVARGGYAVLARVDDPARNGGIPAAYSYTGRIGTTATALQLGNSGDRFVIRSRAGVTLDSVAYTSSNGARANFARELIDLNSDNTVVDGPNWRDASNVYDVANNNRGTPGFANGAGGGTTPTAGPVVSVSVSPASQSLNVGIVRQYTATGRDANGLNSSTTFTWASTDTTVATVTSTGVVTARAAGTTSIRATSANGVVGSTPLTVVTSSTGAVYRNHLEFGVPADADSSNDIRLYKTQYALSYSAARGGPNWVSWDLNASHFGNAARCNCFAPDESLPAGVPRITTNDYTGSGYSRGHMVMSEQRTSTDAENAVTFLMTNILPQIQDMNGGPWLKFETYSNDLARTGGKEVYNIAGGIYTANPATLNGAGKVAIPTHTWKIIVIMPAGQGLANVTSASSIQVIAVNMPNVSGIQANGWEMYRTTVDAIEAATGYDFLSALPDNIEAAVEASQ